MTYGVELINSLWQHDPEWGDIRRNSSPMRDRNPIVFAALKRDIFPLGQYLSEQVLDKTPKKIVDLGGGYTTNQYIPDISMPYTTVVDGCSQFLEESTAATKVLWDLHDRLPFEDQSFDVVLSFFVVRYIPQQHFFSEAIRILRPGGHLRIADFIELDHPREENPFDPVAAVQQGRDHLSQIDTHCLFDKNHAERFRHKNLWIIEGTK